jgi:hypothetical protein
MPRPKSTSPLWGRMGGGCSHFATNACSNDSVVACLSDRGRLKMIGDARREAGLPA